MAVRVQGNRLIDESGNTLILRGVNRSGAEYACAQGWGIFDGPSDLSSLQAIAAWGCNAIRVPLNDTCWLSVGSVNPSYAGNNYQQAIVNYVQLCHQAGLYVILDLHWDAPDNTVATYQENLPSYDNAVRFWQSVASVFRNDPAVMFDIFNEPNNIELTPPAGAPSDAGSDGGWWCWMVGSGCTTTQNDAVLNGGQPWRVASAPDLIAAIRGTGATNVIMVGGMEFANDMTQWLADVPHDPAGQLAASTHIYSFNPYNTTVDWVQNLLPIAASYPVVIGEFGDDCAFTFAGSVVTFADQYGLSYLAWTWDAWGGCDNVLIADYTGTPSNGYGQGYQSHLASLT